MAGLDCPRLPANRSPRPLCAGACGLAIAHAFSWRATFGGLSPPVLAAPRREAVGGRQHLHQPLLPWLHRLSSLARAVKLRNWVGTDRPAPRLPTLASVPSAVRVPRAATGWAREGCMAVRLEAEAIAATALDHRSGGLPVPMLLAVPVGVLSVCASASRKGTGSRLAWPRRYRVDPGCKGGTTPRPWGRWNAAARAPRGSEGKPKCRAMPGRADSWVGFELGERVSAARRRKVV